MAKKAAPKKKVKKVPAKKAPIKKPLKPRGGKNSAKPFQKGNNLWELRTKHGRDKIFSSPEILWEAACEYFEWCIKNPLIEVDFKGKDARRVELPKMRAFTWAGLELYLNISSLRDYKTNELYRDFSQVIDQIEKTIYTQKFEGAAAGFLNANIISRDLGLVDKKQTEIKQEQPLFGDDSGE